MKRFRTLLLYGLMITSFNMAQGQYESRDFISNNLEFIDAVGESDTISSLLHWFSEEGKTDSLEAKLKLFKTELLKYKGRIQFHTIKHPAADFAYNVNLHDPIAKEVFGDIRFFYSNNKDLLIDGWIYFPRKDVSIEKRIQGILKQVNEGTMSPVSGEQKTPLKE